MSESEVHSKSLQPTFYMDFEHDSIIQFIRDNSTANTAKGHQAVELYYAVRDLVRYDPYTYSLNKNTFKASYIVQTGRAWCVPKAILYAACCRSIGVPTQLGFADVRNHLSTERMRQTMKTDIFHWHGYANLFLNNIWVKATPAFNIELCEKFKLKPLEFDGKSDSIYHAFDLAGNKHMEYLKDRGLYQDFPFEIMKNDLQILYSNQIESSANFDDDVDKETANLQL